MQKNSITAMYRISNLWKNATGGQCIHQQLGEIVDVQWSIKQGLIKVSKSQQIEKSTYERNEQLGIQILKGVPFRHVQNCPLLDKNIKVNPEKIMKPCASVMLFDKNLRQILLTQRSNQLRTFPGAWVLPGGHLDPGQGIIQGGVRQCQQQVGLPQNANIQKIIKDGEVMLWQSVYIQEGNVKGCALCLFFVIQCQKFEVKIEPKQVSQYKWKRIDDISNQILYDQLKKQGYARGHLKFLSQIRDKLSKQNQNL